MAREVPFTSKLAYERIMAEELLPPARLRTYDFVYGNGPVTARQVDDALGRDYHKRLPELLVQGVVLQTGTTTCPVTGQLVYLWDITDRLPVPYKKPITQDDLSPNPWERGLAKLKAKFPEKSRPEEITMIIELVEKHMATTPEDDFSDIIGDEDLFRG